MARSACLLLGCLVATLPTAAGCGGPDKDAICKNVESCAKGNDKDVAACKIELDYAEDAAGDLGCSDELDTYLQCLQDHATCQNGTWGIHSSNSTVCAAETAAWERCGGGVTVMQAEPQG